MQFAEDVAAAADLDDDVRIGLVEDALMAGEWFLAITDAVINTRTPLPADWLHTVRDGIPDWLAADCASRLTAAIDRQLAELSAGAS